jgi:hypothetical protein
MGHLKEAHDMASNSLVKTPANLPKRLRELLDSCPKEGSGVHSWLFKSALQLHRYLSEDEIVEVLKEKLSCERPEREICEAIANAGRYARGEMGSASQSQWPTVDYTMVHKIVVNCPVRLKDLKSISPVDLSTEGPRTEEFLDAMFPGNPLLCFGRAVNSCLTKPREWWRGRESDFQFIVPNPMTKEVGVKTDGKGSQRCLDNTGPRRFLVIEFDITDGGAWGPYVQNLKNQGISKIDANVALLIELATKGLPRLPLALGVHSGGKSMHGWFSSTGINDEELKPFMRRAVRLGADKATWTRCQFVRMPDGTRDNGNRQRVHYFAPDVIGLQGGVK